jgi:next-to-BRCA1 protein 1
MESGAAERHNSFHEFFDIETPGRVFVHTVFSGSGERDTSPNNRNATADSPRTPAATPETIRHCAACNMCDSPIVGDRFVSRVSSSHFLTTHDYLEMCQLSR